MRKTSKNRSFLSVWTRTSSPTFTRASFPSITFGWQKAGEVEIFWGSEILTVGPRMNSCLNCYFYRSLMFTNTPHVSILVFTDSPQISDGLLVALIGGYSLQGSAIIWQCASAFRPKGHYLSQSCVSFETRIGKVGENEILNYGIMGYEYQFFR